MRYFYLFALYCELLFLAYANCGCGSSVPASKYSGTTLPVNIASLNTKEGFWGVEYWLDGDKLSYAVITGPSSGKFIAHNKAGGNSSGKTWDYLFRTDGTKIPILGTGRIFFVLGTNVTEFPQRVPGKVFQAFLSSNPSDYSSAALLAYVKLNSD
jgi:hypothetical protein